MAVVRCALAGALIGLLAGLPAAGWSQVVGAGSAPLTQGAVQAAILVLDQDRLFGESRFGKAVLARHQQAVEGLQAENRRIEAALEAEERDLTERRSKLPAAEFQSLAADFDAKAEGIRKAQTAKSDDIKARLDAEQRRFVETARPVLDGMMREMGALVIIDARAVLFRQPGVDVTEAAIARLDAVLGDAPADPPAEAPAAVNPAP